MEQKIRQRLGAACGIVFTLLSLLAFYARGFQALPREQDFALSTLCDLMAATFLIVFVGTMQAAIEGAETRDRAPDALATGSAFQRVALIAGTAAVVLLYVATLAAGINNKLALIVNTAAAAPLGVYAMATGMSMPVLEGGGRFAGVLGILGGFLLLLRPIGVVADGSSVFAQKGLLGATLFAGFIVWISLSSIVLIVHSGRR